MRAPGLILAAPASGSGKTLLTLGLLRYLRNRGLRVAAAKAGPDYIDPSFHAAAGGGPCVNLDPWAMRPATLAGLVGASERHPLWCDHLPSPPRKRGSRGDRPSLALDSRWRGNDDTLCSHTAAIVLCEGVMGLFDGTGPDGEQGSTAALARLTGWPVVLVVDARRQGASAAALVGGFARHDPAVRLAGIIFNRVAGARHRALLEAAMARHLPDIPCLGAVPDDPALMLPERHLGLVPARESGGAAEAVIARAAEAIGEALDVDRLIALARPASLTGEETAPLPPLGARIAVAHDDAFLFSYPAILHGWRRQGAELSFFSPLGDEAPNPAADAVFLPGGYPELHAGRLAACGGFIAGLRRAAGLGATIYGECGGYMALGESLTDADGRAHRMAGLLPLETSFAARRLHLGYRQAMLMQAGPFGPAGAHFRGHEFHYAATVAAEGEPLFALSDACGDDLGPSGLRRGTVMGSFIHLIDQAD